MTIIDENEAEYEYNTEILIKNKDAEYHCEVSLIESEFVEIDEIQASIYDTTGNFIKELDEDNIKESELAKGFIFYDGEKRKSFSLTHNKYPYILKYRYKNLTESLYFWNDWYPQDNIPVLSASYKLVLKKPVKFKYKQIGIEITPEKFAEGKDSVYLWTLKNIPNMRIEDYMPAEFSKQKVIMFTAENFKVKEYPGSFTSWDAMGKWYSEMAAGRSILPENYKTEIKEQIKNETDKHKIIGLLYDYLLDKTRYVAIEMGIAGLQPQKAGEVHINRYGDCKDLSTYMIAMLDVAGIKAYPALALPRKYGIVDSSFVNDCFNHLIAVVPLENEDIWLECTAKHINYYDTPHSIEGIYALVVKENGGELVKTPVKESVYNKGISKFTGKCEDNDFVFNLEYNLTGNQKNSIKPALFGGTKIENTTIVQGILNDNYPNVDVSEFSTDETPDGIYKLNVKGVIKNYLTKKGKRIFISPPIMNKKTKDNLPKERQEERKFPIFSNFPYFDIDSVIVNLPSYLKVETIPEKVEFSNDIADFCAEYKIIDEQMIYSRKLNWKKRIIPVENYKEYLDICGRILKSDNNRFVFVIE